MTPGRPHPGDDRHRLNAYLADRLGAKERAEVEGHLANCDACRSRLVELHFEQEELEQAWAPSELLLGQVRDLDGRVASTGRLRLLAAGLATAVLGGGLWMFSNRQPPTIPTEPETANQVFRVEDALLTLELVSPANGALLPRGAVDLRWTPVVDVVHYRVRVLDQAGVPLAEHHTEEPSWRWAGGDDDIFWYVEAELIDGSRLESEVSRLTFDSAESEP